MAESLSHTFGQIIGDLLEMAIYPKLQEFADQHSLYLDKKGDRPARPGKKLTWTDGKGNKHDLDFVLERGGTSEQTGRPVAFIETAWRRYTKHSRNKAQEIQGAIVPLKDAYKNDSPYIAVILAGEFTSGAINQLDSHGFGVLLFPYSSIIEAFDHFGINAYFDESTSEEDFSEKLKKFNAIKDKSLIASKLTEVNKISIDNFISKLEKSILRYIERIVVLPLLGQVIELKSIQDALSFLENDILIDINSSNSFVRFEVSIRYNTGDKIEASFQDKQICIDFLKTYL